MKDAVGGTWLFQIAIVFIILFAGYLALSVNYSKAFKVKNELLSIIERNEGVTDNAQREILTYIRNNNHSVTGRCNDDKDGTPYEKENNTKALYCVKGTCIENTNFKKAYYKITVFFKLDLPYLGDLFTFKVQGETPQITFPGDGICSNV